MDCDKHSRGSRAIYSPPAVSPPQFLNHRASHMLSKYPINKYTLWYSEVLIIFHFKIYVYNEISETSKARDYVIGN